MIPAALEAYVDCLKSYNETTNVYSKTAYDKLPFHLEDCTLLASLIGNTDLRVLDMGSGSGLPSIPLALLNPRNHVTAVDSKHKKTRFLSLAKETLHLSNYEIFTANISEFLHHQKPHFDVATAKAFAPYEDCVAFLKRYARPGTPLYIPVSQAQTESIQLLPSASFLNPKPRFWYIKHVF